MSTSSCGRNARASGCGICRGFTLVELLLVVAIVAILVALTVAVGKQVGDGARSRTAADTIRVLDQSVEAWTGQFGEGVPSEYQLPVGGAAFPIIDGTSPDFPEYASGSIRYYSAMVRERPTLAPVLDSIGAEYRRRGAVIESGGGNPDIGEAFDIVDPWGNPIRFVHPDFDGGYGAYDDIDGNEVARAARTIEVNEDPRQFVRSWRVPTANPDMLAGVFRGVGTADEGICPGGVRPYFYSAGPDGDPGTREDNVYSAVPDFPSETRGLDSQ
ncbi:MAG: prepilin-type N-terminal cleavage/methylation domain-containing protein [Planctomycetota bacterium]